MKKHSISFLIGFKFEKIKPKYMALKVIKKKKRNLITIHSLIFTDSSEFWLIIAAVFMSDLFVSSATGCIFSVT